jgi:hypothetical protein
MDDITDHVGSTPYRGRDPADYMDQLRAGKRKATRTLCDHIAKEVPEKDWPQALTLIDQEHRQWAESYLGQKKGAK